LIALHVISYVPLIMLGVQDHRNAAATRVFEAFSLLWILLPLGCVYGIVAGKRSLAAGAPRPPAWAGILLNGAYLMIGLLLLLITVFGVTA
jgi:hypothetical protein